LICLTNDKTLSNKGHDCRINDILIVLQNPNTDPSPNEGRIQDFLKGGVCDNFYQYKIHRMLVSSEVHVHVGVIGRGAIGSQNVQDRFQLMNP
jgi:hypothetical protein